MAGILDLPEINRTGTTEETFRREMLEKWREKEPEGI